jgi:hypothetical protein
MKNPTHFGKIKNAYSFKINSTLCTPYVRKVPI